MYDYGKQSRMNIDYESYWISIQLVLVIINGTIKKTCEKYQIGEQKCMTLHISHSTENTEHFENNYQDP